MCCSSETRKVESRFVESAMSQICDSYCRFPCDSSLSADDFDSKCSHCYIRSVFISFVDYPPLGKSKVDFVR